MLEVTQKKKLLGQTPPKFRIGIFREGDFPPEGVPEGLTPQWIRDVLSEHHLVVFLTTAISLSWG